MTLHSILRGHPRVVDALLSGELQGTGHHAYLFTGPVGVGKRTTAFALFAFVNCRSEERLTARRACGVCRSCVRIERLLADDTVDAPPDLLWLRPEGRQIKIAQVRKLLTVVPYPPIESRVRVVVVDPADRLGDEAANALLKTLEEPPRSTRFVLITSRPANVLTTIRSRCQRMRFGHLPDDAVREVLLAQNVPADVASQVAPLAEGSVSSALALIDDPVVAARGELIDRLLSIVSRDTVATFAFAQTLAELGGNLPTALTFLSQVHRQALLARVGVAGSYEAPARRLASGLSPESLMRRIDVIEETRTALTEFNVNPRVAVERLALVLTAGPGEEQAVIVARPRAR